MTAAELKTLREAIGLTVPDLAALAGVQERTVRYWESGRNAVPDDVAAQVEAIDQRLTDMAAAAMRQVRETAAAQGGLPASVVLVRYRENADLWRCHPGFRPLPVTTHAALLARTRAALADLHVRSVIQYMEPAQYAQWLAGRPDSEAMRSAWAAEQIPD